MKTMSKGTKWSENKKTMSAPVRTGGIVLYALLLAAVICMALLIYHQNGQRQRFLMERDAVIQLKNDVILKKDALIAVKEELENQILNAEEALAYALADIHDGEARETDLAAEVDSLLAEAELSAKRLQEALDVLHSISPLDDARK